jgi:hypothetical protein
MNQHLSQGSYDDDFKEWREDTYNQRFIEIELLLDELDKELETGTDVYGNYSQKHWDAERRRRENIKWGWDVQRRLRELIRWEREDLEWERKLRDRRKRAELKRNLLSESQDNREERQNGHRQPDRTRTGTVRRNRQHKRRSHKAHTIVPKAKEG